MTVLNPPSWLQQGSHSATHDRLALAGLIGLHGPTDSNAMLVIQGSPIGMSVRVGIGGCWVPGTAVASQGSYHVYNDGTVSVTLAGADPSFSRKDLIVARVQDADQSGIINLATVEAVTGVASSSPVLPTPPVSTAIVAIVTVPNAAGITSQGGGVINSNIAQISTPVILHGGVMPVVSAVARNALPSYDGYAVYRMDTNNLEMFNGTGWDIFEPAARLGAYLTTTGDSWSTDGATISLGNTGGAWSIRQNIGGFATAGAGATPVTIPTGMDGVYGISVQGINNQAATGLSRAWIQLGGSLPLVSQATSYRANASTGESNWSVSCVVPLAAGVTIGGQEAWTAGVTKSAAASLSVYRVSA